MRPKEEKATATKNDEAACNLHLQKDIFRKAVKKVSFRLWTQSKMLYLMLTYLGLFAS